MAGTFTQAHWEAARNQAADLHVDNDDVVAICARLNLYQGFEWPSVYKNTYNKMRQGQWGEASRNFGLSAWAKREPAQVREIQDLLDRYARKAGFNATAAPGSGNGSKNPTWMPSRCETKDQAIDKFVAHVKYQEGTNKAKDGSHMHIVYKDFRGKITVGYGHQVTADDGLRLGDRINEEQALRFLRADTRDSWNAAARQAQTLGINNLDFTAALASVNYQLGPAWYKEHKQTWALMTQGRFREAAVEAADSNWNEQTPRRVTDFQIALNQLAADIDAQRELTQSHNQGFALNTPAPR